MTILYAPKENHFPTNSVVGSALKSNDFQTMMQTSLTGKFKVEEIEPINGPYCRLLIGGLTLMRIKVSTIEGLSRVR